MQTVCVPVGGAVANAARAGRGVTGALSGTRHNEGGVLDRLDGVALCGLKGGLAGAVLQLTP